MRDPAIPSSYKISKLKDELWIGQDEKNKELQFISSLALVSIYTNQEKNSDSAALYLSKAYDLLPKIESPRLQSKFYYVSGNIELNVKNYDKGLEYLKKCRDIVFQDTNPDSYNLPTLFNSIGVAYYQLNQIDSALFYINLASNISLERKDTNYAVQTLGNLANIIENKDLSELRPIIENLKKLEKSIESKSLKSFVYLIFSNYYLRNHQYEFSFNYLNLASDISANDDEQLVEIYLSYSKYYESINDLEKSLIFYKNYIGLKDSLFEASKEVKLANFESFYKAKLKDEEYRAERQEFKTYLEKSKRRELWFYSIIIGSILLLISVSLYFWRLRSVFKQKRENYKNEKRIQELELENISHNLKNKEKELSNIAIDIARRNEFASKVYVDLTSINRKREITSIKEAIKKLQRYVKRQEDVNKNLEHLQIETDEINFEFYQRLDALADNLTKKEKQLCAFIRLDLSNTDIASLMGISPDTLKNNKSKLKKKFNLDSNINFNTYILDL